ncbi:MAG: VanW family protein [Polyangiaceae bacterium]|nr:VanW family protein [Polyangiaceae bacterium]
MRRAVEWARLRVGRGALVVALAVVAGAAIGVLLVPRAATPPREPPPAPEVTLLGRPLALDDDAGPLALERIRRFAAGEVTLRLPNGDRRRFRMGQLGVEIDKVRLAGLVRDARDPTSPLRRHWESRGRPRPLALPVPLAVKPDGVVPKLLVLKDELDRLPADARLDLEHRRLVPERVGRLLDVDRSLAALERALERGESEAALAFEERRPRRIAAELGHVEFGSVLGFFETRYDRAERYQARTYNLRLAASKLDGTVLMPGEIFDFNEVVGPRDEANGYKVAPVIAEGELVDGIGGGTCQISGTLHGAALFAGLEIVERIPHTRPSAYIKMGLDATVVYPTINLRLKNGFSFPIVLHQTVRNGIVRAEVLGPQREQTVTLIRRIDSVIPYEEQERACPDLPSGARVLGQRGVAGFKLHRYRIQRQGAHAVRERFDDVYPPTVQVIQVGTGEQSKPTRKVKDDPHPEYLADELLVMTQGPGVVDKEGEPATTETREPGPMGKGGWTKEAGMPFWEEVTKKK